jgi:hypothetical protein
MHRFTMMVCSALLCAACTYKAEVVEAPAFNVVSSYGEQIPGKWLLYVESAALDRPIKPSGFACSAHKFPISASGSFKTSARQTLDNVVDEIEVVNGPVTANQLAGYGARGLIVVRGEEIRPRLDVQPGFWTANMATQATMVASVSVDGKSGRIFGTTVEGQGLGNAEAGGACEGGAKALAEAAGQAMKDTMRKMGEAISNSERVRGT